MTDQPGFQVRFDVPRKRNAVLWLLLSLLIISCTGLPIRGDRPRGVYHRVKSGETLSAIAKAYQVNRQELAEVNNLSKPDQLETDSVIFIPDATQVQDDILAVSRSYEARGAAAAADEPAAKTKPEAATAPPRSQALKTETLTETRKRREGAPAEAAKKDQGTVSRAADPDTASRRPAAKPGESGADASVKPRDPEVKQGEILYDRERFIWPLKGKVVSRFGIQPSKTYENGIRIAAGEGSPVQAAAGGVVIFSAVLKNYGETIIIRHTDQYATVYAHLGTRTVRGEARVKKGDRIAFLGKAAEKGEPYLHFEIRHKNKARNPLFFLP